MFELGSIDDLVLPGPSSTTGRALVSMARRRTFENLKALVRRQDAEATALVADLRRSFEARLPGNPHAISDAITDPAIGVLLRRGLREAADAPAYLALGIERLLVDLGDREPLEPPRLQLPIEGPITLRLRDPRLCEASSITESAFEPSGFAGLLHEALRIVEDRAAAMRRDADRFAVAIVVASTAPDELPPWSLGLSVVPATGDPIALARSLCASVAVGKLHALVDGRAHDREILARLRPLVAALAAERVQGRGVVIPVELLSSLDAAFAASTPSADDPLSMVLGELRTTARSGILLP